MHLRVSGKEEGTKHRSLRGNHVSMDACYTHVLLLSMKSYGISYRMRSMASFVGLRADSHTFARWKLRRGEAGTMIVHGGGAWRSWPVAIASRVLAPKFTELGEIAIYENSK